MRSISKIPFYPTASGWYAILPPAPAFETLHEDLHADWVIVGAGFAGLAAAHRLKSELPQDSVMVVDAQRIAWGASGRNSGFMIDLPHHLQSNNYSGDHDLAHELREIKHNRFAIGYARDMMAEFALDKYASDVGRINAATDSAGLQALHDYSQHLDSLNEPFSRLSEHDLADIVGSPYYRGGILMPGCLLIQPAGYIRGIAAGLSGRLSGGASNGLGKKVRIFENSAVIGIESAKNNKSAVNKSRVNKVITAKGSITAKNIILTVNGHLQSFGYFPRNLMHIMLYGSMTRELDRAEQKALGGHPQWGITPAHPMGSTVRRIVENRILVRNHITYNPDLAATEAQMMNAWKRHDQAFIRRFPALEKVNMEHRWSGLICLSRNAVAVFGEVDRGVFAACCQNGLGATKGTLNGILIADLALGNKASNTHSMVEHALNTEPPAKLFPEPLMSLGAKSRLWWGQKQAGLDL